MICKICTCAPRHKGICILQRVLLLQTKSTRNRVVSFTAIWKVTTIICGWHVHKIWNNKSRIFQKRTIEFFRREVYKGIVDSECAGEYRGDRIGQRMVLPSSFIEGPRDMRILYMDAMAFVQHFGRPDLFITMTYNPDWIEIQRELHLGQTPQDRPYLVTKVFRAKLQDLKNQIL